MLYVQGNISYFVYMIARISGVVAEREDKALIVDVHGVGYRVFVTATLRDKSHLGSEITLIIYDHRTDSDAVLFGFEHVRDREYFELLLQVPSIGPKTAMGILDAAPIPVLSQAVLTGDMQLLTSLSGVGKRTAERIVVELKGKLGELTDGIAVAVGPVHQDTVDALVAIGFTVSQAKQAVAKLPQDVATVEEAVKAVLKHKA